MDAEIARGHWFYLQQCPGSSGGAYRRARGNLAPLYLLELVLKAGKTSRSIPLNLGSNFQLMKSSYLFRPVAGRGPLKCPPEPSPHRIDAEKL
jgi:hypothetical protein